jgi:hypothetical protein
VSLVIQIQAIRDQLLKFDFGRPLERTPSTRAAPRLSPIASAVGTAVVARTIVALRLGWRTAAGAAAYVAALATILSAAFATRPGGRTILTPRRTLRLLCFLLGRLRFRWLGFWFVRLDNIGLNCFFHAIPF